ncbi:hypothetical protein O7614_09355 [Micromonospora sp. WMMD961]|uniref:hypothetical protein n=1 Tax=Micromonospora sp. WMMD961 TaxID=3016100 RepID=UPI00241692A1|nr:hypothetical protein [Micromonospora sp. WMMD961]MDG4779848.1 hypothetical protein [Micromonospora sp. WMMD961]
MIAVNIRRSGDDASTPEQVREAASGDWVLSSRTLDMHGDVLLAVRNGRVRGVFDILGWEPVDGGRIRFDLRESDEYSWLVGGESPVKWKQGQSNPVVYLNTDDVSEKAPSGSVAQVVRPRRGVHRIVIETRGLSDDQAAQLHHTLITVAGMTGALHNYRATSLVREMAAAQETLSYDYRSANSPKKIAD